MLTKSQYFSLLCTVSVCFGLNLSLKIGYSLHPDFSLKAASHLRFSQKTLFIDTYSEVQIIAFQLHIIDLSSVILFFLQTDLFNLSDYRVLIALNPAGHKTGVNDGIQILLHGPPGSL